MALEVTGKPVEALLWPPRVLEDQPLTLLLKQYRDLALQPGFLGVVSLGVGSIETIILPEDTALMAEMDAIVPELFLKSLAGSYQEGTIRCIMDIAETYLDRPAGMHDIARGQCRSLF